MVQFHWQLFLSGDKFINFLPDFSDKNLFMA